MQPKLTDIQLGILLFLLTKFTVLIVAIYIGCLWPDPEPEPKDRQ